MCTRHLNFCSANEKHKDPRKCPKYETSRRGIRLNVLIKIKYHHFDRRIYKKLYA